jgi:hypothetical protein
LAQRKNIEEKWSKRINLYRDEIPVTLRTLLIWYLEGVRKQLEAPATSYDDLDDCPF